jgi:hypothetical protein
MDNLTGNLNGVLAPDAPGKINIPSPAGAPKRMVIQQNRHRYY